MSEEQARTPAASLCFITLGAALAVLTYFLIPAAGPDGAGGLTHTARLAAAVGVLMGVWWITEAIPIHVTGLVPLALLPALGVGSAEEIARPYAEPIIFLFLGGMLIGRAMEVSGLHLRFAYMVVGAAGVRPFMLVGGVLLTTAFLSMWVSNTAATVMMLPIGVSIIALVAEKSQALSEKARNDFSSAIILAIAFGASIGGVGTIVGTPPIGLFAGHIGKTTSEPVSFKEWLPFGLAALALMLPACWLVLTRIAFRVGAQHVPGVAERLREARRELGPVTAWEWGVTAVFSLACIGWLTSSYTGLKDGAVAVAAAILLFIIPAGRSGRQLLRWKEAAQVPWGVLLLFGGGLSLAETLKNQGIDSAIASLGVGLGGMPLLPVLFIVALVAILLTEFANNTALVAAALPVADALADSLGVPRAALLVTITLAASLGFAMPAGTAPNALVFSSGRIGMRRMIKAGLVLDVLAAILVPLLVVGAMKLGLLPGVR